MGGSASTAHVREMGVPTRESIGTELTVSRGLSVEQENTGEISKHSIIIRNL